MYPGCPETHSVDHGGLKLKRFTLESRDSQVLGLNIYVSTLPSLKRFLFIRLYISAEYVLGGWGGHTHLETRRDVWTLPLLLSTLASERMSH